MNTAPSDLFSKESEEALLGAVLVNPSAIASLDITADDFYVHRHRFVWQALDRLHQAGRDIDIVLVAEILERMGKLDEVGGASFLAGLIAAAPSSMRAEEYGKVVSDYADRRKWSDVASRIAKVAYDTNTALESEAGDIMDSLLKAVSVKGAASHVSNYTAPVMEEALERMENPQDVWGIPTGFTDFDRITGGLQPGEILYVSGEPGVGKSIFVMQASYQIALNGVPGCLYSLEMPGTQVIRRLLSYLAKVGTRDLKSGRIDPDDIAVIAKEVEVLDSLPLYMSDSVMWTTTSLRADLARLKVQYGIQWFGLDYAYLLKDGAGLSENDRTGFVSARLKSICRSLDIAGMVIHSLNKRGMSGMPEGQDLRGSNQQFYDTDLLLFIVKPEKQPSIARCVFGKGRELENPRQWFDLVRIPGYPALGNATKEVPF